MTGRGSAHYEPQTLAHLVEKSDLLTFGRDGKVVVVDKMQPELDEFGVPRRVAIVKNALATLATKHIWAGKYDLHHLAYTQNDYRSIVYDEELIGSQYRGAAKLKVILPRQLHEYIHAIYEKPMMPSLGVMRELGREAIAVYDMYQTVRHDNYAKFPDLRDLPLDAQDRKRKDSLEKKLQNAPAPVFGIMPDREKLAQMELSDARKLLRSIARVISFSNKPQSQKQFFRSEDALIQL